MGKYWTYRKPQLSIHQLSKHAFVEGLSTGFKNPSDEGKIFIILHKTQMKALRKSIASNQRLGTNMMI